MWLESSSISIIGECVDSVPVSEGRTYICSVLSMRIIKMADLADQTISSHTFSHSFLEKHLDILKLDQQSMLTPEQILEILL